MGLHLYALLPAGSAPAEDAEGVDGAAVAAVTCGRVAAWVSSHAERPQPSLDAVGTHSAVAAAAMDESVTPVPVRFGQWFADEAALTASVAEDEARWLALLDRFRGRAEFGIRVSWQAGARDVHASEGERMEGMSPGASHMARLAQQHAAGNAARQVADEVVTFVQAEVAGAAVEHTVTDRRPPAAGAGTGVAHVGIAFLVARDAVERYHRITQGLAAQRPQWRFHMTGPWPPWSFVA